MRIQMTVSIEKSTNSMLKSLAQTGRYNLYSKMEESDFKVFAPGMKKDFKISGQEFEEKVSYIVYTPKNVTVKMADESSTDVLSPETKPSSL